MTITNVFTRRTVRTKVHALEKAFAEARDLIVQIICHPDSTAEQISEATTVIRTIDAGIKDIKAKAQAAMGILERDRL